MNGADLQRPAAPGALNPLQTTASEGAFLGRAKSVETSGHKRMSTDPIDRHRGNVLAEEFSLSMKDSANSLEYMTCDSKPILNGQTIHKIENQRIKQ